MKQKLIKLGNILANIRINKSAKEKKEYVFTVGNLAFKIAYNPKFKNVSFWVAEFGNFIGKYRKLENDNEIEILGRFQKKIIEEFKR